MDGKLRGSFKRIVPDTLYAVGNYHTRQFAVPFKRVFIDTHYPFANGHACQLFTVNKRFTVNILYTVGDSDAFQVFAVIKCNKSIVIQLSRSHERDVMGLPHCISIRLINQASSAQEAVDTRLQPSFGTRHACFLLFYLPRSFPSNKLTPQQRLMLVPLPTVLPLLQ